MLGSTTLGFHTPFHCKNFIETVDRHLEARITSEHATISYNGSETFVESYPISVEWPTAETLARTLPVAQCRSDVFRDLNLPADHKLVLGVDRFDYTKGILERLRAVEHLLKNPDFAGRFTFLQIAAPTRTSLEEYQAFQERVKAYVQRINDRFGNPGYTPVLLSAEHHEHEDLVKLYRAADVCMVTSLHDGMNLVCKEFIAVRDDESGVLILSSFAGAAQELNEALIVNPYHVEETANALRLALEMTDAEKRERMASLRTIVREFNVYRWAGRILTDAGSRRLRERIEARVERHRFNRFS
jgi:trehalose 6-phosphate synthase